jgi:hypothetical protein
MYETATHSKRYETRLSKVNTVLMLAESVNRISSPDHEFMAGQL